VDATDVTHEEGGRHHDCGLKDALELYKVYFNLKNPKKICYISDAKT
jgi:hypothetical protein